MDDWERRLRSALEAAGTLDAERAIESLVDLALERDDAGEAHLDANPALSRHGPRLRAIYQSYILAMEERESARLLAPGGRIRFRDTAGEPAMRAYTRVDDLFGQVDFSGARRFTMVGSGRLPVTALQAAERWSSLSVTALDLDAGAAETGGRLAAAMGLDNIVFRQADGRAHSYADADIVFVANMVSPKSATLSRVLDTCAPAARLVLREPYGLGRLWTERAEDNLDPRVRVASRGKGSRYLSRNVYLERAA